MTATLAQVDFASGGSVGLITLALYGCVILGGLLSLLWRAECGLYLLTVLLPLQTTRYHLHAFPLGANMVDIILLCTVLGALLRPSPPIRRRPFVLAFLVFLAVFYYISLWRGSFYLGYSLPLWFNDVRLVDYKNFVVMPLLTLAAILVVHSRRQVALILLLCGMTALAVDYSYYRGSIGKSFDHYSEEVSDAGALGYAGENGLASYLVEITSCMLPLAILRSTKVRISILTLIAATTYCILYSYSREAYIALVASICFVALSRLRWLFLPIILVIFSWHSLLPTAVNERVMMTYAHADAGVNSQLDASAQERIMLWNDAVQLFKENPIFGTGFLTYAHMERVGSYRDTHNFYLKMLVETGLLGLTLFVVQIFLFCREGLILFRHSKDSFLSLFGLGFAALIISTAIVNVFGDRWMYIQVSSNLWILLGCVIRANSFTEQSDSETVLHQSWPVHPDWFYSGTSIVADPIQVALKNERSMLRHS